MPHATIDQLLDLGLSHHEAGRVAEAEANYRQILSLQPEQPDALHLLAVLAGEAGRFDVAIELIRRAIAADTESPDFHCELGSLLQRRGELEPAIASYQKAIALDPELVEAHYNLAHACTTIGRLDEAIDCYQRAIELNPDLAEAHTNLGNIRRTKGQLDEAIACHQRAVELQPDLAEAHLSLGVAWQDKAQFDQAIACYRRAVAINPNFVKAHVNLGSVLLETADIDQAIASFRRVLLLTPKSVEAHNGLGGAYRMKGDLEQAVAYFRQALSLKPDLAQTHSNLGIVLGGIGQIDQAIACHQRALELNPDSFEACNNLGIAWKQKGQLDQAAACFRQALAIKPDLPEAHSNLGGVLSDQGRQDEAIECFQRALALDPNLVQAHDNLGSALKVKGRLDEAIACHRRAIALDPNVAISHYNLANALKNSKRLDDAIVEYQRALALDPGLVIAHNNLGNSWMDAGQLDAALACYRRALQLDPTCANAHDNVLFLLQFHPETEPQTILAEALKWNRQYAEPLKKFIRPHANDRDPDRRLRVGYVSPNFRHHAMAHFLAPLLTNHDPGVLQVFCYSQVLVEDEITGKFKASADTWRGIVGQSDEDLAETIRRDKIDILVDLTMHLSDNRMLLFARKPAPIQVTWLAYPGTTGLEAIDFRLTDPYLDPPGLHDADYSERSVRLPKTFFNYDPLIDGIQASDLPASKNGFITFGCLNNFFKVNDAVLSLWAKVLYAVPGSRLILLAPEGNTQRRVLDRLEKQSIAPERIELAPRQSRPDYLRTYQRIDISLDIFPYNGQTTSMDSLWMGVPVITLVGKLVPGRAGLSLMSNLRIPELIAFAPEQYIQIATELAADLPRLAGLRSTLRQRMETSPLMDGKQFARGFEDAYRTMWRDWCKM